MRYPHHSIDSISTRLGGGQCTSSSAEALTLMAPLVAGTVQVWKELCRRDFGALLEAHRQAQRSSAATSSSGAEPMDEEDGDKEEHKKDHKGGALEDEDEEDW